MSVRMVKEDADRRAAIQAARCRSMLSQNPLTVLQAASVRANVRFFRRMAGLRNGDVTGR